MVIEAGSESSAHASPEWHSGSWWSHRHFHVPVVVWIVASVLGGAAIGSALEPDHKAQETPTTIEVSTDQVDAAACNPTDDTDIDGDVNRPSFASRSAGDAADGVADGIACD